MNGATPGVPLPGGVDVGTGVWVLVGVMDVPVISEGERVNVGAPGVFVAKMASIVSMLALNQESTFTRTSRPKVITCPGKIANRIMKMIRRLTNLKALL